MIVIQPQAQRIFSSYSLFNGTFSLGYPIAPNVKCVFEQSRANLATLFDFSDKGLPLFDSVCLFVCFVVKHGFHL